MKLVTPSAPPRQFISITSFSQAGVNESGFKCFKDEIYTGLNTGKYESLLI